MGCCSSTVAPEDIIPDPTGPSTFFCKKAGLISSNYKVFKDNEDGGLWLLLRKKGSIFKDDCLFILENFVRNNPEEKDEGECLAVCKFDTIDAQAYKQYGFETDEADSDDSDGYSEDSQFEEDEFKQKAKWRFKTKCKFYSDRERKNLVATLRVKAKGNAKREIDFNTRTDEEGNEHTSASIQEKKKVKKFIYNLVWGPDEDAGKKVPIKLIGSVNKGAEKLEWESEMFNAEIEGGFISQKPTIHTKDGEWTPGMAMTIGFITCMELAPEDVIGGLRLRWPTVHGPNGAMA